MHSGQHDATATGRVLEILLDGQRVPAPFPGCSLAAIRSHLERLALEKQRILCFFSIDGQPVEQAEGFSRHKTIACVEGRTLGLEQMPLQLIRTAIEQAAQARERVLSAITRVLINPGGQAPEVWWQIVPQLKQPLLTLSLIPETNSGPAEGGASLMQLRKWQLQQLAAILRDVDETCRVADPTALSNALERRVVPWLDGMLTTLKLWQETIVLSYARAGAASMSSILR